MVVFIPHPSEELILVQTQKALLAALNKKEPLWYPEFPLWVLPDLQQEKADAASFRGAVSSMTIYMPEKNRNTIFFPVEIRLNDGRLLNGNIAAGKKNDNDSLCAAKNSNRERLPAELFPLVCRVFRAAGAIFTTLPESGRTWKVTQSFWIKTK
jgi:hypothetical protein